MRRQHRTKIVATLGPATASTEKIAELFDAGVDVFRLNFSHGSQDDHKANYEIIRELEYETGRPIAVLMDLQGPKLRIGAFADGAVNLTEGAPFRLDRDEAEGDQTRVCLPHPEIYQAIEPGTNLLLDDGRIRLKVEECDKDFAQCSVVIGGELSDRKGVNVPGVVLPLSPLTRKDQDDLRFGLDLGVDWVGLSFVQRPEDIAEARKLITTRAAICAKLEKPAAIERLEEIIELSDAVMVARGDLGVEMPPEDVPVLQKRIIRACRQTGKPVIVATQMLESMIDAPTPTRAEASDVATAVYDGADAVMLSAETAAGKYPVEAASMMNRIIERVERAPNYRRMIDADELEPEATAADAISAAARQVAHTLSATAIVTFTTSGSTTLRAARERPEVPIIGLTPNVKTARRLSVVWGVHTVHSSDARDFQDMVTKASHFAVADGFAQESDRIIITAGVPFGTPGATNVLRVTRVEVD
ncbi:MAG: pyruvate kinase [Rhodospirillaceae bacterium]|nr:pyruvate kinase [Rhodospirillaceae bacterium]MDD9924656.1 pyruvate kinase [Rhodospirillaceae bacterium]